MNSIGHNFRLSIFGESHGNGIGVIIDGAGCGIELSEEDFVEDLARRRSGSVGTTPRKELDRPEILSGVFNGRTTGAPIAILFRNENTRSADYEALKIHPRPSHADMVAEYKYGGFNDLRGGGHFSGRMTLCMVAAGVIAKKMLGDMNVYSSIKRIGNCIAPEEFENEIKAALADGDSVGGLIEVDVDNVERGLGEPFFDSFESVAAHLLFSIPAVKGVEFGRGFGVVSSRGSENNDPIVSKDGKTASNNDGGVNGGITNGNRITVRVAVKPTPSISKEQNTLNVQNNEIEPFKIQGRHDACIALRAQVVAEAAIAIALADLKGAKK